MSVYDYFSTLSLEDDLAKCSQVTPQEALSRIGQPIRFASDFAALLSPAAQKHLETLAQHSHALTVQRFGKVMQLFVPMYLSNLCYNNCTYCGFSITHQYERKTLTEDEIMAEAMTLKQKGFSHILLLTGEAPGAVDVPYISQAIRLIRPHFASVGIEVQPFKTPEYQQIIESGADSLTLYQETYHPDQYLNYHLSGKKRNFKNRLNASDEAGKAGFYRFNLGALLGLYDWRYEAMALFYHIRYMQKHYWKTKLSISFPRIQKMVGSFAPPYPVTDADLVQLICAFRLAFPDLGITLSTREPGQLRNHLIPLGVTQMSAESDTSPGGYSGCDAEKQFEISDERSLDDIQSLLSKNGFEPVFKDWDATLSVIDNRQP